LILRVLRRVWDEIAGQLWGAPLPEGVVVERRPLTLGEPFASL